MDFQKNTLDAKMDWLIGEKFVASVGRFIAQCGFEELVLLNLDLLFPDTIAWLGQGLGRYQVILSIYWPCDISFQFLRLFSTGRLVLLTQIERVAVARYSIGALLDLVQIMRIKTMYVEEPDDSNTKGILRQGPKVHILSQNDWNMRFTNN